MNKEMAPRRSGQPGGDGAEGRPANEGSHAVAGPAAGLRQTPRGRSGLQRIEVGAFVSPETGAPDGRLRRPARGVAAQSGVPPVTAPWCPTCRACRGHPGQVDEIGLFTACSDGFTRANIGIGVGSPWCVSPLWWRRRAASASR